jgi:kynureninase
MEYQNTIAFAKGLDELDPLKEFRSRFIIPQREGISQVYFLGNSLGLQPRTTQFAISEVLQAWADYGVEAFFHGNEPWMEFHDKLTGPLSEITGAKPSELAVMNQLSVNLHLMLVSFYQPTVKRRKIICEAKAFPSDQYVLETYLKHLHLDPADIIVEVAPRANEYAVREEDILKAVEHHRDELALLLIGGINYYTGQLFDIERITAAVHAVGGHVGFDLAHAAGNVALKLHDWNVDFACWCSYKYLNSGPGAVGGVFIHERFHEDPALHRLAGWWGYRKESRFRMDKGFIPVNTAEGWHLSTPSMILYACHYAALRIFEEAKFERILTKARLMSDYFLYLLNEMDFVKGGNGTILTPLDPAKRGCQVSLSIRGSGRQVFEGLSAAGFFADWREPDVIRVAPVPLYNTFCEIHQFSSVLGKLIKRV